MAKPTLDVFLQILVGAKSNIDRKNWLHIMSRDCFFTTKQAAARHRHGARGNSISGSGFDVKEMMLELWTRLVDERCKYDFLVHNVDEQTLLEIAHVITFERFVFTYLNPDRPLAPMFRARAAPRGARDDQHGAGGRVRDERAPGPRAARGRASRQDTSQKGNYCNFRNETLNKSPVTVDKLFLDEKLAPRGDEAAESRERHARVRLRVDDAAAARGRGRRERAVRRGARQGRHLAAPQAVQVLGQSAHDPVPARGRAVLLHVHAPASAARARARSRLLRARSRAAPTTPPKHRGTPLDDGPLSARAPHLHRCSTASPSPTTRSPSSSRSSRGSSTSRTSTTCCGSCRRFVINEVVSRLGWLNIFSPLKPSMRYEISLVHLDARRFTHVLLGLAAAESAHQPERRRPGAARGRAAAVMISGLYAQISQLVSNPSANVARFRTTSSRCG